MLNQPINSLIRDEASSLTLVELLNKPVTILRGVSTASASALKKIYIEKILDLAASSIFMMAKQISDASQQESRLGILGNIPADMVDAEALSIPLNELYSKDISILKGIGPDTAKLLQKALSISTIRDLALWTPYLAAVTILNELYGLRDGVGDDPEAPQELVPRTGQLPTEKVQYNVVLFDRIFDGQDRSTPLTIGKRSPLGKLGEILNKPASGPLPIETAGALDISLTIQEPGFSKPALGAILTITQSWFTHGLALGQLLHTIALAPGESTRIAMIDWSRAEKGNSEDNIGQTEWLDSTLDRKRTINEVINAVVKESQSGFSGTVGGGLGTGSSEGGGGAGVADLESKVGFPLKVGAATGQSLGLGISAGGAASWANSNGQRDIDAKMTQNVIDSTHQASSSVRNLRATRVVEVSQSESEKVSTRALTNFNHMHALSIQYYEVVQLYRTVVETTRVEACLFIPMKPLNFRDAAVRERFKRILGAYALTPKVQKQTQIVNNQISISSPDRIPPWNSRMLRDLDQLFGVSVGQENDPLLVLPLAFYPDKISFTISTRGPDKTPFDALVIEDGSGKIKTYDVKSENPSVFSVSFGNEFKTDSSKDSTFWNMKEIRLSRTKGELDWVGIIKASLSVILIKWGPSGTMVQSDLAADIQIKANENSSVIFRMQRTSSTASQNQDGSQDTFDEDDFIEQLVSNSLYYSQIIWASLDAATLGMLLSKYTFSGRPLIEVVDPIPVSMAGNYLAFRMHGQEDTEWWKSFLQEKGLKDRKQWEDLVPMPTGGVFGEAVLGRFNSAEKLDITRFWNWQDSPIPITAPEIAAINTGSRAQPMDLTTGDLNAPVVTISNPPAIPDPQGLTAAITALANGNMFRDMSGLAGTIGFAQAAMQTATQAGIAYGQQSSQNAAIAADLLAKMYGKGGTGGVQGADGVKPSPTSPATISNAGGRINYGEKLDQQNQGKSNTSSGSSSGGIGTGPTNNKFPNAANDAYYTDLGGYQGSFTRTGVKGGGLTDGDSDGEQPYLSQYPGLDPSLSEPKSRTCCALFPGGVLGLYKTDYLDLSAVPGHEFGSYGLNPSDSVGQIYTAHGGFVDLGHVRDLADMTRYLASKAILGQQDRLVLDIQPEGGSRRIIFNPYAKYPNVELAIKVGARAAYELAIWHEIVTYFTNINYSSFSPEDNYSNLLGALVGAMATSNRGEEFNKSMDIILVNALKKLDPQPDKVAEHAIKQVEGLWYKIENDLTGALSGGDKGEILLRRHIVPLPHVTPWLVTDLDGRTFDISDPVAGTLTKTIDMKLGSSNPASTSLTVPTETTTGLQLSDYFKLIIDVDTWVVPPSVLPGNRTSILSSDLPGIVTKVRQILVGKNPHADKPIDP